MARHANQTRYKKRQKDRRGMVQVAVWVPEGQRQTVLDIAEHLREGFTIDIGNKDNDEETTEHRKEETTPGTDDPGTPAPRRRRTRRT